VASYTVPGNNKLSNKKNKSSRSEVLKRLAGKEIQIPVPIISSQEIGNELFGRARKDYDDAPSSSFTSPSSSSSSSSSVKKGGGEGGGGGVKLGIIEDGEDDDDYVEEVSALESQQGVGTKSEIVKLRAKLVEYESKYPKGDSRTTKLKKILKSLQRVNCDS
jgi:hypothetical protein